MATANDNTKAATASEITTASDHVLDQITRCHNAANTELAGEVDRLTIALGRLQNMRLARKNADAEQLRALAIVRAGSFLQAHAALT